MNFMRRKTDSKTLTQMHQDYLNEARTLEERFVAHTLSVPVRPDSTSFWGLEKEHQDLCVAFYSNSRVKLVYEMIDLCFESYADCVSARGKDNAS